MRYMALIKSDAKTEAGLLPEQKLLEDMGKYNDQLAKAGVMLGGEGLYASSRGAKVRYAGGKFQVVEGPFADAKAVIAGYWLLQAKSKEEAIEWVKRCPVDDAEIEIREIYEITDFPVDPEEQAGEWRDQEEAMRAAPPPVTEVEGTRRYVIFMGADAVTESGAVPSPKVFNEMGALIGEIAAAGKLLGGEGLKPTSKGAKVQFQGSKRTVIDGPFAEAKELVAGFTLLRAHSKAEAIEWAKRHVKIHVEGVGADAGEVQVRELHEIADFPG